MTSTPAATLGHPLIAAYLDDLDRALSSADPQERVDTVASIREHIADRLTGIQDPTSADISRLLAELGSVERIAGAATPAPTPTGPVGPTGNGWVGPAALGLAILSAILLIFNFYVAGVLAAGVTVFAVTALRRRTSRESWMVKVAAGIAVAVAIFATAAALTLTAVGSVTDSGPGVPVSAPQ